MNYQRMWYILKERLMKGIKDGNAGNTKPITGLRMLEMITDIECAEAAVGLTGESGERCCNTESCGAEQKQEHQEQRTNGDTEGGNNKEVLRDIFGADFVEDLDVLRQKIEQKDGSKADVIMVDADLDVPEELEKLADEKKIMIARAECVAMGNGFSFRS